VKAVSKGAERWNGGVKCSVTVILLLDEIVATGKATPDAFVSGWLRYEAPGTSWSSVKMGGDVAAQRGTWELVVDPNTKTVYHFLFQKQ
jgi:hypothetical protein